MRFTRIWASTRMRRLLATLLCWTTISVATAADISDPTQFVFVGDSDENVIAVVSLAEAEVVFRIDTSIHPDHIIATPFAPILMYTDTEARKAVFYDLRKLEEVATLDLPVTPRHVVLDTTGAKIGISDEQGGGFVLLHAYKKSIEFSIDDFPPTADVLFDPNDVDIYFSNSENGSIGMLDINTQQIYEMPLVESQSVRLSPPSRSLDARYVYVSNLDSGEVYSLNAYSRVIFNSFSIGESPARPYTTPQGAFLYMLDTQSGRFVSVEQRGFTEFVDVTLTHKADLVVVGRFDRLNLFSSSSGRGWTIFDNVTRELTTICVDWWDEFNGVLGTDGICDSREQLFDIDEDYWWDYDNNGLRLAQLRFYMSP